MTEQHTTRSFARVAVDAREIAELVERFGSRSFRTRILRRPYDKGVGRVLADVQSVCTEIAVICATQPDASCPAPTELDDALQSIMSFAETMARLCWKNRSVHWWRTDADAVDAWCRTTEGMPVGDYLLREWHTLTDRAVAVVRSQHYN